MDRRDFKIRKEDFYYKQAKLENKISRSYYKLIYIFEKERIASYFKYKKNLKSFDVGCALGGWIKATYDYFISKSVKLKEISGIDIKLSNKKAIFLPTNSNLIEGDFFDLEFLKKNIIEKKLSFDILTYDLSENISGDYFLDHCRNLKGIIYFLNFASKIFEFEKSKKKFLVIKHFEGFFTKNLISLFKKLKFKYRIIKPPASRKSSSEIYFAIKTNSFNLKEIEEDNVLGPSRI